MLLLFLETLLYQIREALVNAVGQLNWFVFDHFLLESLHLVGLEWHLKRAHLVQDYAEGPYVTFLRAGFVLP